MRCEASKGDYDFGIDGAFAFAVIAFASCFVAGLVEPWFKCSWSVGVVTAFASADDCCKVNMSVAS